MKKTVKRSLLCILAAVPMTLALSFVQRGSVLAQDQNVQVIEMTAKKYEFSPAPVRVKAGTKVELKITATDRDHGFKISTDPDGAKSGDKPGLIFASPQECVSLKKGEAVTIEFLAQTPGTYTFKCCRTCGFGHGRMKGQLVVE